MNRRVLIVPDKFKGTLTAAQAAEAMERGWRRAWPTDQTQLLAMSDGGDGFGDALGQARRAEARTAASVNAAGEPIAARWWWVEADRAAIIESAQAIGLALLPPKKFHPFELDSAGVAPLCQAAARAGAHSAIIGVGGSATNDAGFGFARAIGCQFLDSRGQRIARWTDLQALARICLAEPPLLERVTVAVDVQNPLLGQRGATRVYGPQKGLRPEDFSRAERCLTRLADIVRDQLGIAAEDEPGAGAAGGLGYGLRCFLGARLESGFHLFARATRLEEKICASDVVLTGEGAIDDSTLMGKGAGEVADLCRKNNVPCLGLCGWLDPALKLDQTPFARLAGVAPQRVSRSEAERNAAFLLESAAFEFARQWPHE